MKVAAVAPVPGRIPRPQPRKEERRRLEMRPLTFQSDQEGSFMLVQWMTLGAFSEKDS